MEDRKKKVNTIWERSKCTRKMGNKKSNWTIGKKVNGMWERQIEEIDGKG